MYKTSLLLPTVISETELDRLQRLFSGESEMDQAGRELVKDIRGAIQDIERIPHYALSSSLKKLNQIPEDDLTEEESRRANGLAKELSRHESAREIFTDSYLSLRALEHLSKGTDRKDILNQLRTEDWMVQTEVLLRRDWMAVEKQLMEAGNPLENPFRCRVARRGQPNRSPAKEFYQLRQYLHGLKANTGEQLLYIEKRETPDFHLADAAGQLIGVEVSEVPISSEAADEMDAESEVFEIIQEVLGLASRVVTMREPASWRALRDKSEDLRRILGQVNSPEYTLRDRSLDLEVRIKPKSQDGLLLVTYSNNGETSKDDKLRQQDLAEALYTRIRRKIFKNDRRGNERLKKEPEIKPCRLVFYPNFASGEINLETAINDFRNRLDFEVSSHFDQIWLSGDSYIIRVL